MTVAGQGLRRLVRLSATIAFLCSVILVWQAAPARADGTDPGFPGSVLHVSASGPLTPRSVLTITATGTNPPYKYNTGNMVNFGLDLFLADPDQMKSPCATTENAELTLAANNPRYVADLTYNVLNEGLSGPFKISTQATVGNASDHLLVCAYSMYGYSGDVAWASTEVLIGPGNGGGGNGGGTNQPGGGSTQPGTGTGVLHDLRQFSIVPLVWTGLMVVAGGITLAVLAANGTLRGSRRW